MWTHLSINTRKKKKEKRTTSWALAGILLELTKTFQEKKIPALEEPSRNSEKKSSFVLKDYLSYRSNMIPHNAILL